MAGKKGGGTLQAEIIKMMGEKAGPTDLWVRDEVMAEMDITDIRQAENALYNAWRSGKIYRHKDQTEDKQFQYALKIKEADRRSSSDIKVYSPGAKKRKGTKPTAKEIRMAFMEVQRAFTRLEDLVMPVIESAEDRDKVLDRLKNII